MSSSLSRSYKKFAKKLKTTLLEFYEGIPLILKPIRLFKFICFWIGFAVIAASAGFSVYGYSFFNSLPDFGAITFSDAKTISVKKIQSQMKQKTKVKWTSLENVSRDLLYAVVMSEDSEFFEHSGVNYNAIWDATIKNLKEKEFAYGASTISQQVTKNLFLGSSKTISRKLKEAIITRKMEAKFSKNQILELYLNLSEFGPDVFGVHRAAYFYFGKSPTKINAAEGAFLAIMLPSPRRYHYSIIKNRNLTLQKKKKINRILKDMLHHEFISAKQYWSYLKYPYYKKLANGRAISSDK